MQSITITGHLGSGKSTIAKMLSKELGFTHYSTGDAQREIARQMGLTTLELNHLADHDASIDEKIDGVFKTLDASGKAYVIDSRLAWHFMPRSHPRGTASRREGDPPASPLKAAQPR